MLKLATLILTLFSVSVPAFADIILTPGSPPITLRDYSSYQPIRGFLPKRRTNKSKSEPKSWPELAGAYRGLWPRMQWRHTFRKSRRSVLFPWRYPLSRQLLLHRPTRYGSVDV